MEVLTKIGDLVKIDFEGRINGELFKGGSAKNYYLTLGANEFVRGFEKQLVGKKVGEVVNVNVKFPKNYFDRELAGCEAVFKTTIKYIVETNY